MMKKNCIIGDNTVTSICTQPMGQAQMACMMYLAAIPPQHLTIGRVISISTAFYFVQTSFNKAKQISLEQKHRHGELVENDVAKCDQQSS
ncbi:hypothetical protein KIN20_018976 [Parelaphostrongylus tenuis]|uniref:Uncharacterized protein n=1 Tax=Parelaphostrongylus tenuis TaxID=148309 RepID=A0AAD5QRZ4_PARTN|nr:hypothetical protein KIN20_018976 [Parelaphostrongylus tenuis]